MEQVQQVWYGSVVLSDDRGRHKLIAEDFMKEIEGCSSIKAQSPRTGGALKTEASKLGLSTSGLSMFQQAEAYGNMRNAPSSFVRSFMDKQAQVQIDIVNTAQEKASKIRTEKTNKAFATKNEKMYNDANKEYEKRMETVRAFRDKLTKIGNKFLS